MKRVRLTKRPTISEPTRKPTALAQVMARAARSSEAACPVERARSWDRMMPWTTERRRRPRTSSMTAAPRMIWASLVVDLLRSRKTRAVMPTLVADRVAPRKR